MTEEEYKAVRDAVEEAHRKASEVAYQCQQRMLDKVYRMVKEKS